MEKSTNNPAVAEESLNFIEQIITDDLETGKHTKVLTRFPPEPNGYLHIGHCKAICINFGIAEKFGGQYNLRFDDTNPVAEDTEFVNGIIRDIKWLGFDWADRMFYASDYFPQLYAHAVQLIKEGKAYVEDSTKEEMAEMRGVPHIPGTESPYRNRSVEENLELFEGMKDGKFEEGSRVLRAKIDMSSPNMHMRDPAMYRILKAHHHRTGDTWNIYPMYDFAHGVSDSIEGVTHSLCSLEFENHRPLYEWFNKTLKVYEPQQIEFARLNLSYTVTSKRKLRKLVEEGVVTGWDDPRMPTITAMRRRGYPPMAIRKFIDKAGVAKRINVIDLSLLEFCIREELNKTTDRNMAVLDPVKVVITNFPAGETEIMSVVNNPGDPEKGSRDVPFSNEIWIEKGDFMEEAPKKYFRLKPGGMVRLKGAYIIQCDEVIKDDNGEVTELRCSYITNSRSGQDESGLKVKGTIHWVSAPNAIKAEARIYDRLFMDEAPDSRKDDDGETIPFMDFLNPDSLTTKEIYVEPALKDLAVGTTVQFMRKGYFCLDPDSSDGNLIFNQTIGLRDSWAKKNKK